MANHQDRAFDDLRNTFNEYARIIRSRWRMALVGLGVVGSIAFWYSQYLPRQYRASTIFERRDDTVLQNLIRSTNSPYSFGQLKSSISLDMTGSKALAKAAVEVGILPTDSISSDGALSNDELRALGDALARYDLSASVTLMQSSDSLDVIQLLCNANNPQMAHKFAVALRDRYMDETTERINGILRSTRDFFRSQMESYRDSADRTNAELKKRFSDFPGVDPTDPASAGNRLEALRAVQSQLEQRQEEIEAEITTKETFLRSAPSPLGPDSPQDHSQVAAAASAPPRMDPKIRADMESTRRQITDMMTSKRMTAAHPRVKALYRRMDQLFEAHRASAMVASDQPPAELPPPETNEAFRLWRAEKLRVELELDTLRGQLSIVDDRFRAATVRVDKFSAIYDQIVKDGGTLRKMQARLEEESTNAGVWRQHQAQLSRIMAAEKEQRGHQFTLIEEPKDIARALKPRSASIFAMCLGLGLAAAALLVALSELLDRSFRSIGQVTRVLGIPVLECVGTIATPQELRRRRISRLIWTPAVSVLVLALLTSASLAYVSLEKPGLHHRAIAKLDGALSAIGAPPTRLGVKE